MKQWIWTPNACSVLSKGKERNNLDALANKEYKFVDDKIDADI